MNQKPTIRAIGLGAIISLLLAAAPVLANDSGKSGQAEVAKMDANRDGQVSPTEHATGARDMFTGMDTDRNGQVSVAEMDAKHAGKPAHERVGKLSSAEKIRKLDTNGDGSLSAAEHAAGSVSMFSQMDQDADGLLTAAEIQAGHDSMLKNDTQAYSQEDTRDEN